MFHKYNLTRFYSQFQRRYRLKENRKKQHVVVAISITEVFEKGLNFSASRNILFDYLFDCN